MIRIFDPFFNLKLSNWTLSIAVYRHCLINSVYRYSVDYSNLIKCFFHSSQMTPRFCHSTLKSDRSMRTTWSWPFSCRWRKRKAIRRHESCYWTSHGTRTARACHWSSRTRALDCRRIDTRSPQLTIDWKTERQRPSCQITRFQFLKQINKFETQRLTVFLVTLD